MPEPMTIAALLGLGSSIANAGAGYYAQKDLERAQRRQAAAQKQENAMANLSRAFGGNPIANQVPLDFRPGKGANLLSALGQLAGAGSQAVGLYGGMKDRQAQNRLRDLQTQAAANQLEQQAGAQAQTAGGYVPIQVDEALRGTSELLAAPIETSSMVSPAFRAGAQQQRMDDLTQQAQLNLINANAQRARAAGGTSFSGSNRIRIAADAGSNVATLNPFLRGDEAKKLIVEQSGSMSPELLTSAVAGYNEQAAQIRDKFNAILDGAVKQATNTNYEDGVLALEAGLQAQGYDLSENMLSSFLDRIDAASDAYNFSATEKKQLMQLTTIRANALRAIETLTDPEAIGQIQEAFGRSEGAIKKARAYLVGEQEAIGPEAANFLTQLGFLRDTVARYRSGAALTEAEQDFYEGLVGGIFTQPEQLRNTLGELVNQMNREITSLYEVEAISRGKGPY